MKARFIRLLVFVAGLQFAITASGEPLDLQVRYPHAYATYVINEDGTATETHDWSMTVLKDTAVEWSKRTSVSYSTSAQKAEVIAAYTKKADGRRIDVPANNYQVESNRGNEKGAPAFSDITSLAVVFPDVTVGDTVFFSYRVIQTEPLFPGQFSMSHAFPQQVAFDDVRVRFDYPASLWVQHENHGMTEKENSDNNGRKVIEWAYANPAPVKDERRNFSVYDPDKEPGFAFSTFRTYKDIATAYGARALPKAAVTDRIQKLAAEIVKDKTAPKDQARALYEWVATNITYGGNCIGIGTVVPRDVEVVLDNKMGDCKDHATLLQALLAARGIQSTQALVNAGSVYRLPKIPVVATVNHVINYLPAFDVFVDSTSDSTPFGMLPFQDADKPVLLVEGFKEGVKTPPSPVGATRQTTNSTLKVAADGSISGTVAVTEKGQGAVATRAWARKMTKEMETDFVKNTFLAQGMIASGKLEKEDPSALTDSNSFKVNLKVEKFAKVPGAGAFFIYPLMNGSLSIHDFVAASMEPEKEVDVTCTNGSVIETYSIELPKTMKVLSVPDNLKLANKFLTYNSTYKLKGNVLTVKRELDDRTKGSVCPPEVFVEYKKFADKIVDDLKSQVLYK